MKVFELIGIATAIIIVLLSLHKVYRYYIPKKYNWNNCPNDHDTMARSGADGCNKCKNKF